MSPYRPPPAMAEALSPAASPCYNGNAFGVGFSEQGQRRYG